MTIEDKWKEAEENLKDFNESIELIKKFPLKGPIKEVKCQPYEMQGPIVYPSYSAM